MATQPPKGAFPFQRGPRAAVWEYFDRSGEAEAKCRQCGKCLVYKGGTSSMREHLRRVHPSRPSVSDTSSSSGLQSKAATTPTIAQYFASVPSSGKTCSPATARQITDLIVDWLTTDLRPLSVVNDEGFRHLLSFLAPGYKLPSRTHVAKLIKERHVLGKKELARLLKQDAIVCSLTTDGWSSKATQSFNTVTCHFINKDWSLVSAVLDTSHFPCSHTAGAIAEKVQQSLGPVALDHSKVISVTHDEAANAVAAGRLLAQSAGWESVTCAAHLLQTAIRHAIDSSRPVQKLLASCRRMVGHFRQSNQATEALLQKERQMEVGSLKLVQDVATRWNSSYYMFQRSLPIMAVLTDVHQKKEHRQLVLKDAQWGMADELVEVLKPLEVATTVLSGQQYVTSSLVLPMVVNLVEHFTKPSGPYCTAVCSFRADIATELSSKFSLSTQQPTSPLVLSASLDPRFRQLSFLSALDCDGDEVKMSVVAATMKAAGNQDGEDGVPEPEPKKCKAAEDVSGLQLLFGSSTEERSLSSTVEEEVLLYFSERPASNEMDPLVWWKANQERYPHLGQLARKMLCIPATSVPAEQVFSTCGLLVNKLRCALSPASVDAMVFLAKNSMVSAARSNKAMSRSVPSATQDLHEEDADEEQLVSLLPQLASVDSSDEEC